MDVSVRVATAISLLCIGAMAWAVYGVARPTVPAPPLHLFREVSAGPGAMTSDASPPAVRFARDSAADHDVRPQRRDEDRLVVAPPRIEPRAVQRALPPLSAVAGLVAAPVEPKPQPVAAEAAGRLAAVAGRAATDAAAGSDAARDSQDSRGGEPTEAAGAGQPKVYVVKKGDSLWRIARSEWKAADPALVRLLIQANPAVARRGGRLRVGEKLSIPPRPQAGADVARVPGPERPSAAETRIATASVARSAVATASAAQSAGAPAAGRWYTIRRNDSLIRIARRELKDPQRWQEIVALNGSLDPRRPIHPGMRIRLPPA